MYICTVRRFTIVSVFSTEIAYLSIQKSTFIYCFPLNRSPSRGEMPGRADLHTMSGFPRSLQLELPTVLTFSGAVPVNQGGQASPFQSSRRRASAPALTFTHGPLSDSSQLKSWTPPEAPSLDSIKVTTSPAQLNTVPHRWRATGPLRRRPAQSRAASSARWRHPSAPHPPCSKSSRVSTLPATCRATSLPPVPRTHQPCPPRKGAGYRRGNAHGQHLCRISSGCSSAAAASGPTGTKWLSGEEGQGSRPTWPGSTAPRVHPPDANLPFAGGLGAGLLF